MIKLIMFWFIRIACAVCFIVNIVVTDVHNIASFGYFFFGMVASLNIYGMGLFAHETYKSLPSLFIVMRLVQLLLLFSTKCLSWHYLALHAGLDAVVFGLYIFDNRWQFILKEQNSSNIKTTIRKV